VFNAIAGARSVVAGSLRRPVPMTAAAGSTRPGARREGFGRGGGGLGVGPQILALGLTGRLALIPSGAA
jgi:hypothetical protein